MVKIANAVVTTPLALLLLMSTGWTQVGPTGRNSSDAITNNGKERNRHWTGALVDMGCMSKTLGPATLRAATTDPALNMPHLSGWGAVLPQEYQDQQGPPEGNVLPPGQQGVLLPAQDGNMPQPAQRAPVPDPATMAPLPEPLAGQHAASARATTVNRAVKECSASAKSAAVGIATGEGQVLKFDPAGTAKAKQALISADPQLRWGKKIKAKVAGTIADDFTLRVAAIEIKGIGSLSFELGTSPALYRPPNWALLRAAACGAQA